MDVNTELAELEKLHKNLLRVKNSSNARDVVIYLKDCAKKVKNPTAYTKILNGVARAVRDDYSVGCIKDAEYDLIVKYLASAFKRCK